MFTVTLVALNDLADFLLQNRFYIPFLDQIMESSIILLIMVFVQLCPILLLKQM